MTHPLPSGASGVLSAPPEQAGDAGFGGWRGHLAAAGAMIAGAGLVLFSVQAASPLLAVSGGILCGGGLLGLALAHRLRTLAEAVRTARDEARSLDLALSRAEEESAAKVE